MRQYRCTASRSQWQALRNLVVARKLIGSSLTDTKHVFYIVVLAILSLDRKLQLFWNDIGQHPSVAKNELGISRSLTSSTSKFQAQDQKLRPAVKERQTASHLHINFCMKTSYLCFSSIIFQTFIWIFSSHHMLRECVVDQAKNTCAPDSAPYSATMLDKALSFLRDQCSNFMWVTFKMHILFHENLLKKEWKNNGVCNLKPRFLNVSTALINWTAPAPISTRRLHQGRRRTGVWWTSPSTRGRRLPTRWKPDRRWQGWHLPPDRRRRWLPARRYRLRRRSTPGVRTESMTWD